MAGKLAATFILSGPDGEPQTFGPDSTDIPDWAAERIGDHGWEGGKRPAKKATTAKSSEK